MIYLLDTNAVTRILTQDAGFLTRLRRHCAHDIGISAIVTYELYFGALKGRRTSRTMAYIDGLAFETVDFNREDARAAAEIRTNLTAAGTPVGPYDILIAGQALARGLTLITHNTREFSCVQGLRLEDWEA